MIGALPLHEAPPQENETKLYICHDMQGGYQQDLFLDHNSPSVVAGKSPAKGQMAYRCLHLEQSDVFNYFSHHNITVPPRHWRILCRRYGTRCLGTFITEGEDYSENMLTSK
jgi:mannosyl-glycoprotein endo-beta-N-acetylglucosaminidase